MDNRELAEELASYPPDTDWFREFIEARRDSMKYKESCLRKDEEMSSLTVENERLREDNNEYAQINGMMQKLLVSTANALKGDPKPRHIHDWSDLPKVAKQLREEHDERTHQTPPRE
jgi:hypothetical protein